MLLKTKFSYIYLSACFLVVFSAFFLIGIIHFSPVYVTLFMALIFLLLNIKYKKTPDEKVFVYIPFVLYIVYLFFNAYMFSRYHEVIIMAYFTAVYIYGDFILYQINSKQFTKIIKYYLNFNLILMVIDLIYRVNHGKTELDNAIITSNPVAKSLYRFYFFKESFFWGDSNGTGVVIIMILSVLIYLISINPENRYYKKMYFLFFILLLACFARASIASHVLLLLFIFLFLRRNIYFKFLAIFIFIMIAFLMYNWFLEDGSFLTKIELFEKTYKYLKNASTHQILFGNGTRIETAVAIMSRAPHNYISNYIIMTGLISLILFLTIFLMIYIDIGFEGYLIIIPYFITGLSVAPLAIPYVYVAALLIKHAKIKLAKGQYRHKLLGE
jgi:hypothetical protein